MVFLVWVGISFVLVVVCLLFFFLFGGFFVLVGLFFFWLGVGVWGGGWGGGLIHQLILLQKLYYT
ncbi:hypothetical protein, partial [Neisseria sp. P0019.S002]|uniref:hypothetical protein n=1 Tax=Neisseria sp. P0019.S002 TaxID=3436798 RepID=UPI003F7E738B